MNPTDRYAREKPVRENQLNFDDVAQLPMGTKVEVHWNNSNKNKEVQTFQKLYMSDNEWFVKFI